MKNKLLKGLVASLALIASGIANAGFIDFNLMPDGTFSGNGDFDVTTYGGPESDASLIPIIRNGYLCNSSDVLDTACDYPTERYIDFDFNNGMDWVNINVFWAGDSGSISISSYDINGDLLQTFGYLDGDASYTFDSTADIYSVVTSNGYDSSNWWYGVNSIEYVATEVPEPSTLAILALSIMGLASRKFKNQA